ncbi:unnamed protein product [Clonostachys rosea f. rosea IK726]|uniref:Uncharacterized protein n=1 Tax=Clonostachys rosea f. rosea IK726 TaxID=1349383 RepID=A0ACA9UMF2_BIOOC|nr:unnamed protein product [Clonostachys rosea f. rosea IK726]
MCIANDVYWRDIENGKKITSVSASNVSSSQLKLYLDQYYPERYSVQLKRDIFRITITGEA